MHLLSPSERNSLHRPAVMSSGVEIITRFLTFSNLTPNFFLSSVSVSSCPPAHSTMDWKGPCGG